MNNRVNTLDIEIRNALKAANGNMDTAYNSLLSRLRVTPLLLWELWDRHEPGGRNTAIRNALAIAAEGLAATPVGSVYAPPGKPVGKPVVAREAVNNLGAAASPAGATKYPVRPTPKKPEAKNVAAAAATAASVGRSMSPLYRIRINGLPLAECRVEDALTWAERQITDGRIVQALCNGLPPNEKVGDHISEKDVASILKRANMNL